MKRILIILVTLIMFPLSLFAVDITISWDAVTPTKGKTISYYRVYQSYISGNYTNSNVIIRRTSTTSITMPNLPNANIYWVVTAIDSSGYESEKSVEVTSKWFLLYRSTSKYGPPNITYWYNQ